ncbi:30S ribosome-binding factor RbfA [Rappaport israeli]|uniref:30S ribosome-binding factor RbfA n=1 Tax=Rappaport israeli TaxID=1839807 RepID=UPI0009310F45|nr:30S ribosome-binding factor RbfA [Rappaport israeli]
MAKGFDRTRRIGEQMRRDLSQAVVEILDHPNASLLSFTDVRVTRDLSFAKVFVTYVLEDEEERDYLVKRLNACAPQFRHYLAKRLSIRKMPELTFYYDESVEYGAHMEHLLTSLVEKAQDKDDDTSQES